MRAKHHALLVGALAALAIGAAEERQAPSTPPADYQSLVNLYKAFAAFREPAVVAGVPDYTQPAMEAQRRGLDPFRHRLLAIDPDRWPISQKVDYLVVRAAIADLDFKHRVLRPWTRDPGFYLDLVFRIPYLEVPIPEERVAAFETRLRAVPRLLEQARANLTDASGVFARIALRDLDQSDGVNLRREPLRATPPAGIIGWYRDLIARLHDRQPALIAPAEQALTALERYRDWLRANEARMTASAAIGQDNCNWYLRQVRLMSLDVSDLLLVGQRERDRALAFLRIEQHRNRGLAPIEPAPTEAELARRVVEAEAAIRVFLREKHLLTIPDTVPAAFSNDIFWRVRPGRRNFWEEIVYRDPINIRIHNTIPGHELDGLVARPAHPIRPSGPGPYADRMRAEGWAFYLEEMLLQAGLLDGRPRSRELFYLFQLQRAVRIPGEIRMLSGEWTLEQAIAFWMNEVPMMDENLARTELQLYLRNPLNGIAYTIGKALLEGLLADRSRQLGDQFDLGAFHDQLLAAPWIPFSLIRWEMTGLDDEVRPFWEDVRRDRAARE